MTKLWSLALSSIVPTHLTVNLSKVPTVKPPDICPAGEETAPSSPTGVGGKPTAAAPPAEPTAPAGLGAGACAGSGREALAERNSRQGSDKARGKFYPLKQHSARNAWRLPGNAPPRDTGVK